MADTDIVGVIVFRTSSKDSSACYVGLRHHNLTAEYVTSVSEQLTSCQAILISCDIPQDAILTCKDIAAMNRIPVIINAAPYTESLPIEIFSGALYVIATEADAQRWASQGGKGPFDISKIGEALTSQASSAIITRGSQGCVVFNRNRQNARRPKKYGAFENQIVIQHTGTRSTFCAAVAVKVMESGGIGIMDPVGEKEMIGYASAARTLVLSGIPHPTKMQIDDYRRQVADIEQSDL